MGKLDIHGYQLISMDINPKSLDIVGIVWVCTSSSAPSISFDWSPRPIKLQPTSDYWRPTIFGWGVGLGGILKNRLSF